MVQVLREGKQSFNFFDSLSFFFLSFLLVKNFYRTEGEASFDELVLRKVVLNEFLVSK